MTGMRSWTRAALIRALKTAAQAALGVLGTGAIGLLQVDWANVLSVALMGAVLSMLTSIAGLPEVDDGSSLAQISDDTDAPHGDTADSTPNDIADE